MLWKLANCQVPQQANPFVWLWDWPCYLHLSPGAQAWPSQTLLLVSIKSCSFPLKLFKADLSCIAEVCPAVSTNQDVVGTHWPGSGLGYSHVRGSSHRRSGCPEIVILGLSTGTNSLGTTGQLARPSLAPLVVYLRPCINKQGAWALWANAGLAPRFLTR